MFIGDAKKSSSVSLVPECSDGVPKPEGEEDAKVSKTQWLSTFFSKTCANGTHASHRLRPYDAHIGLYLPLRANLSLEASSASLTERWAQTQASNPVRQRSSRCPFDPFGKIKVQIGVKAEMEGENQYR